MKLERLKNLLMSALLLGSASLPAVTTAQEYQPGAAQGPNPGPMSGPMPGQGPGPGRSAGPGRMHNHRGHSHGEIVAYRLADWHEMHFDDAAKAAQHLKAVQDLGCEVRQMNHEGHVDVVYRCPEWKQAPVRNHQLAEQWLAWLKGSGFDTHHPDVAPKFLQGSETIDVRLMDWKTAHMDGSVMNQAQDFTNALREVGCEVRSDSHGNHVDVAFRCPVWVTLHVPDHAAAEQWQTWLQGHGFETKHSH